jgi:hypothetical protein
MSNETGLHLNLTRIDNNFSNFSPSNASLHDRLTDSEVAALRFCHNLLGCVGFVENLAVVAVILHNRQMLDFPANWFVLSLALSDAFACVVIPLAINVITIPDEKIGQLTAVFAFIVLANSGNLFMLTFNRFLSVYNSLRYPEYMTTKRAKFLVLIPWLNAVILQAYAHHTERTSLLGSAYFGALIFSFTALNAYLLKKARKNKKEIKQLETAVLGATKAATSFLKEYGLVIRLTIVSFTFFASCIPIMVLWLLHKRKDPGDASTPFKRTFVWCVVATELNSIIDPLVYSVNHPIFRRYFDKIRNRLRRRNRVNPGVLSRKKGTYVEELS